MSLMKRIFSTESTGKRLSIAFLDTGISPVADFILKGTALLAFAADTNALINLSVIAEGGRASGANPF